MNKRFGVKKLYAICSLASMIIGPLFIITGIGLLIFSPIGKLISLFIILFGVYFIFQGKVIANNEININDDYVYIKSGVGFKTSEKRIDYNEILSVKGNSGGGVAFDTKIGIITAFYIDNAVECAGIINDRIKNDSFNAEKENYQIYNEDKANDEINVSNKVDRIFNVNIPVDENHHQCQNCSHVQRKEINRCLKCGELIENL